MVFLHWSLPILNYEKGRSGWYQDMPPVTDWSESPDTDWSTNVPVSLYYNNGTNYGLRREYIEQYIEQINSGDTVVVGVDWYGLTGLSSPFIPPKFLTRDLMDGDVNFYKVYLIDSLCVEWIVF